MGNLKSHTRLRSYCHRTGRPQLCAERWPPPAPRPQVDDGPRGLRGGAWSPAAESAPELSSVGPLRPVGLRGGDLKLLLLIITLHLGDSGDVPMRQCGGAAADTVKLDRRPSNAPMSSRLLRRGHRFLTRASSWRRVLPGAVRR